MMAGDEDDPLAETTQFSVATLRDLVARTGDERLQVALEPMESSPAAGHRPTGEQGREISGVVELSKPAPVLVFPEQRRATSVVAPPVAAAPIAWEPMSERASTPPTVVVTAPAPVPRVRRSRAKRGTSLKSFLARRLLALGLLAVAMASQPWWWNVGDLRSNHPDAARTGPQSLTSDGP
jgi:hypothetical protein